jgi:gamma-glutamylcyclotransferase
MKSILYFAYGSNMMAERLRERCKSARFRCLASVEGYSVTFNKRSADGSAKATIVKTADRSDRVYGVVFDIPIAELPELDRAEGCGAGYVRIDDFTIVSEPEGAALAAATYIAEPAHVDPSLRPYDWYLKLVVRGAKQNGLGKAYVDMLRGVEYIIDLKPDRKTRLSALRLLGE